MLNTLFSVADIASSARCHTKLAAAGMGVVAAAGNASADNSGRLVWNRKIGFSLEGLHEHDYVPANENTSWLDGGGVWAGGGENSQRCIYMRDTVVYAHILCTYKQVMRQCKKTANTQMAHLVFADTRAKTQKTKRAIFLPTHR